MSDKSTPNSKKPGKAHIHITGMTCTTCAATLEKGLAETPGVEQADVSFASEKASIEYDPSKVDFAKIKDIISQIGYGVATKKSIFPSGGGSFKCARGDFRQCQSSLGESHCRVYRRNRCI